MVALQAAAPFFQNDQLGLLKVLVVIVAPIIGSVGLFVWSLANRAERHDINEVGKRVNGIDSRVTTVESRADGIEARLSDDRLAYSSQLWTAQKSIDEQFAKISTALARVEERVCAPNDLKDAMVVAMREVLREARKERERE